MELWISQSSPLKQMLLSLACVAIGLFLAIGFRGFESFNSNAGAGFLLGILLLVLGVPGFVLSGKQTVTIDPRLRQIVVEDSSLVYEKKRSIPFGDVVEVHIGYLGRKTTLSSTYHLVLKLRNGEDYALFAPGRFFEGASNRSTVVGWKERLERYLENR
jgi:hypothetical protein